MHQLIDKKNRIVIYLIFLLILSTTSNKTLENQKNYSTTIKKINVLGLSNSKNLQIENKLNYFFYKNILMIKKEEIIKIISKYNIIEEYNIKKIYPSKLNINIKPTKIIAQISNNNKLLVGANGKLITTERTDESLPYLFGVFKAKEFLKFKKNIESSRFNFTDFKSILFYPSNRWDVITIDNILIKLPENNLLKSLNLAHKIIANNSFQNNRLIDLRISNHLIIQ